MPKQPSRILASRTHAIARGGAQLAPHAALAPTLLAAALLAAFAGSLAAQERSTDPGESPRTLAPVVVTATRVALGAASTPASVSVVGSEALALRAPLRIGDALADVPGVYLRGAAFGASPPASGQAVLSLRGIPRTVRTLVMIDGHPINNALSGGINVASLITDQIDRIEVVRGPYSALYGGNAMGGVINVITASPDQPLAQVRAGIGNFGQRAGALALRHRLEGGLGITLAAGWRESAGYADSDDVVKPTTAGTATVPVTGARATTTPDGSPAWWLGNKGARPWTQHYGDLGLHWNAGPATRVTVGFAHTGYRVGYSGPDSFLRNSAGESVYTGNVSVDGATGRRIALAATDWFTPTPASETDERFYARLNHRFADGTQLAAHLGMLSHRFTFSQASAGRATYDGGPGELTEQPNRRIDVDVSLRKRFSPQWAAVGGVAVSRGQLDRRTVTLVNWRDQDTKGNGLNSGSGVSESVAVFGQLDYRISDDLTAYAGGRADRVQHHGEVTQNTAPAFAIKYGNQAYSQFSPKLALVWQASPSVSLRGSYGQGFRPPALLDLYSRTAVPGATAGTDSINDASPELKPERVRSLEVGADWQGRNGAGASVTLYSQRLNDLIYRRRLSPTLTKTENAAQADVDGIEAQLSWPLGVPGVRINAMLTHLFRYDITRNSAVPASEGKRLTDVPQTTASLALEGVYGKASGFVALRHVSRVFGSGDDLNRNTATGVYGAYDAYTTLAARIAWQLDRRIELSLAGENLTNRRYFAFGRQPGRMVFGQATYRW